MKEFFSEINDPRHEGYIKHKGCIHSKFYFFSPKTTGVER